MSTAESRNLWERDVDALLDQLGLNRTFFVELGIFTVLFLTLSQIYFRPFLKLFESRHKKTVEDKEAAERLMIQAQTKFEEYKRLLTEERIASKKSFDQALSEAKKQETEIIAQARDEAKRITLEAAESVNQQRDRLSQQLNREVELVARSIVEKLVSRKI